jgi:hypothetical protein
MRLSLKLLRHLFPFAVACAVGMSSGLVSTTARADDADVARIVAAGHSLKWNWTPPGKGDRYGHAEVLIHAPLAAVRAAVSDFGRYKDLVPDRFHNARIIGKENGTTDVYMQVPILHGLLTLWDVVRFAPVKVVEPGTEVLEGTFVRGNIRNMNAVWTTRAVNDTWTLLKFDLLLSASLPAPQSAIDEELRDAAMQAVDAIHDRAQGHRDWERWTSTETASSSAQ